MGMRGLYRPNAKLIHYFCNHSHYIGGGGGGVCSQDYVRIRPQKGNCAIGVVLTSQATYHIGTFM